MSSALIQRETLAHRKRYASASPARSLIGAAITLVLCIAAPVARDLLPHTDDHTPVLRVFLAGLHTANAWLHGHRAAQPRPPRQGGAARQHCLLHPGLHRDRRSLRGPARLRSLVAYHCATDPGRHAKHAQLHGRCAPSHQATAGAPPPQLSLLFGFRVLGSNIFAAGPSSTSTTFALAALPGPSRLESMVVLFRSRRLPPTASSRPSCRCFCLRCHASRTTPQSSAASTPPLSDSSCWSLAPASAQWPLFPALLSWACSGTNGPRPLRSSLRWRLRCLCMRPWPSLARCFRHAVVPQREMKHAVALTDRRRPSRLPIHGPHLCRD